MARTCIFGKSGSGKSWYTGKKIADILEPEDEDEEFEYAIHFDIEDEERGLSLEGDSLLKTFECDAETLRRQVAVDPEDPPDYIPERELESGPLIALPKWVVYKNKYVRVVPIGLKDDERIALSEMMADAAMKTGDCHFSMDEAHVIAQTGVIGPRLERLITGGRKRGVEWAFITQRPQAIHKQIIAQSDIGIFFQLTSDRDLTKADHLSENFDAEETLPELGNRICLIENYNDGTVRKVSTENLERKYPHVAGDDGKANDKWIADGEEVQNPDE